MNQFWSQCRTVEKWIILISMLALTFCAGREYSIRSKQAILPPLFTEVPVARGASRQKTQQLFVHVSGAVRRTGVQKLPSGARVKDAVQAAGGPLKNADVNEINLAARLHDGQKIDVPIRGSSPVIPVGQTSQIHNQQASVAMPSTEKLSVDRAPQLSRKATVLTRALNVNTASVTELQELPGVGPTIAAVLLRHGASRVSSLSATWIALKALVPKSWRSWSHTSNSNERDD
jgi:DNA uptake protein ComE-like DNA-binding protein